MKSGDAPRSVLTLEPLIDAVREGVEGSGWSLSGLQKTTSYEFEGRWEGDSTRSAYLFFHSEEAPQYASIDAYLDETSRGLTGNLALVVDLRSLGELGDAGSILGELADIAVRARSEGDRTPITLRLRLGDGSEDPGSAEVEARFKVTLSRRVISAGASAVRESCAGAVAGFERLVGTPALVSYARS